MYLYLNIETPNQEIYDLPGIPYGLYCLIILEAVELDPIKGKNLFLRTVPDITYHSMLNLDLSLADDDEATIHYDVAEIQAAIDFINGELIPEIQNKFNGSYKKYGGRDEIIAVIENGNSSGLFRLYPNKDEELNWGKRNLLSGIDIMNQIFKESIRLGVPYEIF